MIDQQGKIKRNAVLGIAFSGISGYYIRRRGIKNMARGPKTKRRPIMAKVFCKWCGIDRPTISVLAGAGSCSKSPSKNHEAFDGDEQTKYFCEYCGIDRPTISVLAGAGTCSKSPTKGHVPAK
jgi:hypothetical protein